MANYTVHPKLKVGDTFDGTEIIGCAGPHISPSGTRIRRWTCRCGDCSKEYIEYDHRLKSGKGTNCGCLRAYVPQAPGAKFGKWTVIGPAEKTDRYNRELCQCECGIVKPVLSFSLTSGESRSCPRCKPPHTDEAKAKIGAANFKHGLMDTPEYRAWQSMLNRCLNPTNAAYEDYGARGITVCEEWKTSFQSFLSHMGKRPSDRHSIDRVDNEKGYSPDNCQWREYEPQNRNRRNTVWIEWNGQQITLAEACEVSGTNYYTAWTRIFRLGWSAGRALNAPLRKVNRRDRDAIRRGADPCHENG